MPNGSLFIFTHYSELSCSRVRTWRLFGGLSDKFPAQPFGAARPADCGTIRGQTRQAGGADRSTARARPADDYENGFFSVANFDERADNGTSTAKQRKKKGADLKNPHPPYFSE
jgi:hypothetical protein